MVPSSHPPRIGHSVGFFFAFFLFFPLLFNILQSESRRGLARGHTFLLTQVFLQQAGGPAGDKAKRAPLAAPLPRVLGAGHFGEIHDPRTSPDPGTAKTSLATASPARNGLGFPIAITFFVPGPQGQGFVWLHHADEPMGTVPGPAPQVTLRHPRCQHPSHVPPFLSWACSNSSGFALESSQRCFGHVRAQLKDSPGKYREP